MPVIHLVEGPVGSGKSTYAARLGAEHAAPRFIPDEQECAERNICFISTHEKAM